MPFQKSAESWWSRTPIGRVKTPVLVGVCVVAVVVLVFIGQLLFGALAGGGIEYVAAKEGDGAAEERETAHVETPPTIYVHVSGAVAAAGVYEMTESARVRDAVAAAGGFSEGAAPDALNLARPVTDGEQIVVPTQEEMTGESTESAAFDASAAGAQAAGGKVNINRATAAELDTLPGIGPSTAERIVADRETNGPFASTEDLKRVSGIGDKKFAALADQISIG